MQENPMPQFTEKMATELLGSLCTDTNATVLSPGPAPASTSARAAVKRCCAAWNRTFRAYMEQPDYIREGTAYSGALIAGKAYRNAMPLLVDYENILSFIACVSHGILIGAIPKDKSGQLTYAAQVALSTVQRDPRRSRIPKSVKAKTSKQAAEPAKSASGRSSKRTPK